MKHLIILLSTFLIALTSCASAGKMACKPGLEHFGKVSLYFGTSYPDGIISDSLWQNFVSEVLVQEFPEGMSIHDTEGHWLRPDGGKVSEPGKIVVHLYKAGEQKDENIQTIISEFKRRFMAQSVIWEEDIVCAGF